MHPIEHLRYVARAGDLDPSTLATEAAEALGSLSYEPRALVTSCRRLIEFHPSCAPLWWVAAHILASDNPGQTARECALELEIDCTSEHLVDALPSQAVVFATSSETIVPALLQRPDISSCVVGGRRSQSRLAAAGVTMARPDDLEELEQATLVVCEPRAVGPSGYLLSGDDLSLFDAAQAMRVPTWVVAGIGRVLPGALFDACRRSSARLSSEPGDQRSRKGADVQLRSLDAVAFIVGPDGAHVPTVSNLHPTCPVPKELCQGT